MHILSGFIDVFLHLDSHLNAVILAYGGWTYFFLFTIIFCETGLVVTPFLPGDSLLFASGALAASGSLELMTLYVLLNIAAVTGNILNYQIGNFVGPKVFHLERARFFKKEHLERTHRFYEKYGGFAIVLGRFMPIIRTFAPFLAGVGKMGHRKFLAYNLAGSGAWVSLFLLGGYFFGNIPVVKNHFTIVILAIIIVSMLPSAIAFLRRPGVKA